MDTINAIHYDNEVTRRWGQVDDTRHVTDHIWNSDGLWQIPSFDVVSMLYWAV